MKLGKKARDSLEELQEAGCGEGDFKDFLDEDEKDKICKSIKENLNSFSLDEMQRLNLSESNIHEFRQLL